MTLSLVLINVLNRVIHLVFFMALITIFMLQSSCSSNQNKTPKGIIPEAKMDLILTDMHLADAVLNLNYPAKGIQDTITWRAKSYRELILKKYKISQKQFVKSFDYYVAHPAVLDAMYEKMIIHLTKVETKLQADSAVKPKPRSQKLKPIVKRLQHDSSVKQKPKSQKLKPNIKRLQHNLSLSRNQNHKSRNLFSETDIPI